MRSRLSAEKRRLQLVEAGLAVADKRGLSSVTIRAVAEEADVSLGVVHYCFEDKVALIAAMLNTVVDEQFQASVANYQELPREAFSAGAEGLEQFKSFICQNLLNRIKMAPHRWQLIFEAQLYLQRLGGVQASALARRQLVEMGGASRSGLQFAIDNFRLELRADITKFIGVTLALTHGTYMRWLLDHDDEIALRTIRQLLDLIAIYSEDS